MLIQKRCGYQTNQACLCYLSILAYEPVATRALVRRSPPLPTVGVNAGTDRKYCGATSLRNRDARAQGEVVANYMWGERGARVLRLSSGGSSTYIWCISSRPLRSAAYPARYPTPPIAPIANAAPGA